MGTSVSFYNSDPTFM